MIQMNAAKETMPVTTATMIIMIMMTMVLVLESCHQTTIGIMMAL
jgi:hypothetical protein